MDDGPNIRMLRIIVVVPVDALSVNAEIYQSREQFIY